MTETQFKTFENRLRRIGDRLGLKITKSRDNDTYTVARRTAPGNDERSWRIEAEGLDIMLLQRYLNDAAPSRVIPRAPWHAVLGLTVGESYGFDGVDYGTFVGVCPPKMAYLLVSDSGSVPEDETEAVLLFKRSSDAYIHAITRRDFARGNGLFPRSSTADAI